MPIGFWAVSREEVKESLAYWKVEEYHKQPPTAREVDRVVKHLRDRLDEKFREIIVDFARGELE